MKRLEDEFCLLLEGVSMVEAELAQGLLLGADIPCLLQGPDFDMAELGVAARGSVRGTNVYVPTAAEAAARELLDEAWEAPED